LEEEHSEVMMAMFFYLLMAMFFIYCDTYYVKYRNGSDEEEGPSHPHPSESINATRRRGTKKTISRIDFSNLCSPPGQKRRFHD
jgi:hypothetical protein